MNERLKELVQQAKQSNPNRIWEDAELERFAELVRQEEREACAALCEMQWEIDDCAKAIRARVNDESLFNN
jgi:hypothetical protein